jgi:hypothetical protein
MDSVFSSEISPPEINIGNKEDKAFNFFLFIIVIITFIIVVVPWDKINSKKIEGMSGGTLAQMFAQDSQDVYLKGNVDKLATGNATLMFNQPTRQLNTFQNRGQPMYSILLPDTSMNPTNDIMEVSNNYVNNVIDNEVYRKENKLTFSNPVLTLDNVLPSKTKPKINSLAPKETNDYETVNNDVDELEQTNYLTFPEAKRTKDTQKTTKTTKTNKTKKSKSVPTVPENILPSSLPIDVISNSNPYELSKVAKQVAKTKKTADNLPALTNWTPQDYLFQAYTDRAINDRDCIKNPASCGSGAGGSRLNDAFVQSTKAVPYVNLDGNYFYPDSYTGHYFNDNFNGLNIMKPYPVILDKDKV